MLLLRSIFVHECTEQHYIQPTGRSGHGLHCAVAPGVGLQPSAKFSPWVTSALGCSSSWLVSTTYQPYTVPTAHLRWQSEKQALPLNTVPDSAFSLRHGMLTTAKLSANYFIHQELRHQNQSADPRTGTDLCHSLHRSLQHCVLSRRALEQYGILGNLSSSKTGPPSKGVKNHQSDAAMSQLYKNN